MGHVLHGAGGSTGQSRSSANWKSIQANAARRLRENTPMSDDAEWIPTTHDIRDAALFGASEAAASVSEELDTEKFHRLFDRWLEAVKADAWDRGVEAYYTRYERDESLPLTNPYRKTGD